MGLLNNEEENPWGRSHSFWKECGMLGNQERLAKWEAEYS